MNAPSAAKRPKLSYCDIDFLVKLQKTIEAKSQKAKGDDDDGSGYDLNALRHRFLSLISYGADVNVNLNWTTITHLPPELLLSLTACAGEVNCDSEDSNKKPLHQNDHVRVRMDQEALVRLLTGEGMDVNCPHIVGDLGPLILEEVRRRFTILKALVTFGTDTNRIRPQTGGYECDEGKCGFCWNLQFLCNFGELQQHSGDHLMDGQPNGWKGLVLNALMTSGSDVNCIRCGGGSLLCTNPSHSHGQGPNITDLLFTNGYNVNSVYCDG